MREPDPHWMYDSTSNYRENFAYIYPSLRARKMGFCENFYRSRIWSCAKAIFTESFLVLLLACQSKLGSYRAQWRLQTIDILTQSYLVSARSYTANPNLNVLWNKITVSPWRGFYSYYSHINPPISWECVLRRRCPIADSTCWSAKFYSLDVYRRVNELPIKVLSESLEFSYCIWNKLDWS